ncbi:hypothetical protein ACFORJ_03295 [Corynebacterium hansenii]|uniref:HEAT repeat domain-containing protein n=1 Tax=Corynebacterium hansenii TaxID=394964 RepID=A0ABV7ZP84_9CORY|nr:hypothetical protein [Corynebacterium hansenii]WJY98973.1 hypothetical protein CHAN_01710 [Corynebacterium hansenii]
MYFSSGHPGGDPRGDRRDRGDHEASALRAILRLAELDDGTGYVLGELEATLAGFDDDVRDLPTVRVAALPFLAELHLGLGDDARVAELLEEAVERARGGDDAARVVSLRMLRALCRMDAIEMRSVVKRLLDRAEGADPVLVTALELSLGVLDAVAPGAHPLALPRLPGRFADAVFLAGDPELLCFFADVEVAIDGRENDDLRIAEELDREICAEAAAAEAASEEEEAAGESGGAGGAEPGCGGPGQATRPDDFGDSAPGV